MSTPPRPVHSTSMNVPLIGATGTLGSAVATALRDRGHDVMTVGRTGGDLHAGTVSALVELVRQGASQIAERGSSTRIAGGPEHESYSLGISPVGRDLVARAYVRATRMPRSGRVFRVQQPSDAHPPPGRPPIHGGHP